MVGDVGRTRSCSLLLLRSGVCSGQYAFSIRAVGEGSGWTKLTSSSSCGTSSDPFAQAIRRGCGGGGSGGDDSAVAVAAARRLRLVVVLVGVALSPCGEARSSGCSTRRLKRSDGEMRDGGGRGLAASIKLALLITFLNFFIEINNMTHTV